METKLQIAVKECRRTQKDYYAHKHEVVIKPYLDAARQTEAQLDAVLTLFVINADTATEELELYKLATDMRKKQKEYHMKRNSAYFYTYLNAAKKAEGRIDELLSGKLLKAQIHLF